MTRIRLPRVAAAILALAAACQSDSTAPARFDAARLRADVQKAEAPFNTTVATSLASLGTAMDNALGASLVAVPAAAIASTGDDPMSAGQRIAARAARARPLHATADVIPATLQGRTLEYDPAQRRYVPGTRSGAPANGTRFILYAVDPLTDRPVVPLVETGYADVTRTITNAAITARLEAYSVASPGASAVKRIDYAASLSGTVTTPQVRITGFATDGTDRLDFTLTTLVDLAAGRVTVTNEAAVPTQQLTTRAQVIVDLVTEPGVRIDGRLGSAGGTVEMTGRVAADGNGSVTVRVNGQVFATITVRPGAEPTIVNAAGQPVNAEEADALRQIFEWFEAAGDLYEDLSKPVERVLGL